MTGVHQQKQNRQVYSVEGADAVIQGAALTLRSISASELFDIIADYLLSLVISVLARILGWIFLTQASTPYPNCFETVIPKRRSQSEVIPDPIVTFTFEKVL